MAYLSEIWLSRSNVLQCFICLLRKYRTALLLLPIAGSFLSSKIPISSLSQQHVVLVCQLLHHLMSTILYSFLSRSYLYVLLNLIIIKFVVNSGVLKSARESVDPVLNAEDESSESSMNDCMINNVKCSGGDDSDVGRSNAFGRSCPGELNLIEYSNIEVSRPLLSKILPSSTCKSVLTSFKQGNSITVQETTVFCDYEDQATGNGFQSIVLQDSIVCKDVQLLQIDEKVVDSDKEKPHEVDEGEGEISRDELNAKAEAFIMNFYQRMRQESLLLSIIESRYMACKI